MFRLAGIALCVLLDGANAKYKNADEVIMLQTSMVLPAMGEQAAIATDEKGEQAVIATDEKHDMPQKDVESANTTSVISTKKTRVHNPVGDGKAVLKQLSAQLRTLKLDAHELQQVYQECTRREASIIAHQGKAQRHLDNEAAQEPKALEVSVQCNRCLDHCVCVNDGRPKEVCDAIVCDRNVLASIENTESDTEGSNTAGVVPESAGGKKGTTPESESAGGKKGNTHGGKKGNGGADAAGAAGNGGADDAGAAGSDADSTGADGSDAGSSDAGGSDVHDSSAAQEQTESGNDEGKQATADSSGNSGNNNNEDYGDEETASDEEAGKSLSFRPALCFALFAPLFQLL